MECRVCTHDRLLTLSLPTFNHCHQLGPIPYIIISLTWTLEWYLISLSGASNMAFLCLSNSLILKIVSMKTYQTHLGHTNSNYNITLLKENISLMVKRRYVLCLFVLLYINIIFSKWFYSFGVEIQMICPLIDIHMFYSSSHDVEVFKDFIFHLKGNIIWFSASLVTNTRYCMD